MLDAQSRPLILQDVDIETIKDTFSVDIASVDVDQKLQQALINLVPESV